MPSPQKPLWRVVWMEALQACVFSRGPQAPKRFLCKTYVKSHVISFFTEHLRAFPTTINVFAISCYMFGRRTLIDRDYGGDHA